jgi:hypothetical protein
MIGTQKLSIEAPHTNAGISAATSHACHATRKPKLIMMVPLRTALAPDEVGAWTGRSILGQSCDESTVLLEARR